MCSSDLTAEIGHYIVQPHGKMCRCGRQGCLETLVSTHALIEQVKSGFNPKTMPKLNKFIEGNTANIEAKNMKQWIHCDDKAFIELIDHILEPMARTVVNTITLLAPDKVILYGQMFEMVMIREHFIRLCNAYDQSYDESYIALSKLSDRIEYIGPLAVVANELFFMGEF